MVAQTSNQMVPTRTTNNKRHRQMEASNKPTRLLVNTCCGCPPLKSLEQPHSLLFAILLPFLVVLVMPSVRLVVDEQEFTNRAQPTTGLWHAGQTGELLLALLRLPLDRIRLQSGGLLLAQAREISAKGDLQEEETHMLLLAPAEHRSSYAPAPATYQYGGGGEAAGGANGQHESGAVGQQGPGAGDYGPVGGAEEAVGVAPVGTPGQAAEASGGLAEVGGSSGSTALQARSDLPAVRALNVKCEKNHMTVNIVFDRPFYGMVFSKGHYNDQKCVHLPPNSGQTSINFDIHLGKCGMSSSDATGGGQQQQLAGGQAVQQAGNQQGQQPNGVYIENTIIIQYDPLVQEIFDQARKLRCTWYDYYEKSVTFRPYNVDMLDAVTANFLGDNIQCWMQIQVGKGPWSSEVAGIVKIGQTMTMVLAIKDDENRFDMLVRNCVAHDGKHQPIQLVDEYGCVARPKIMGRFQKVRNFGPAATVVSYAHFQAFKFPDSMSVHFQCVIQVCRYECPEPVCNSPAGLAASELGGPQQAPGANGSQPGGDYATSGTEMVASKEPPAPGFYNSAGQAAAVPSSYANHSHVNLKLDESQGRVQVKLDTSMMAGLGGRPPQALIAASAASQQAGPLPPHLLHMAAQQQASGGGGAPFRPTATTQTIVASSQGGAPTLIAGRHHHHQQQQQQQHETSTTARMKPSGGANSQHHAQIVHYSPQYGASAAATAARRSAAAGGLPSAFASRLGELAHDSSAQITPPYEADYNPLSLIGSPRGLKLGATTPSLLALANLSAHHHQNLRVRRAANGEQQARSARHLPLGKQDSTSVQTQRSIQVVSPDDVAFSLLDPSEESPSLLFDDQQGALAASGGGRRVNPPSNKLAAASASSVCFTTTRFLWGVLVTLAALVSSIVIVTYVILKQRSQLDQKLASVFVQSGGGGGADCQGGQLAYAHDPSPAPNSCSPALSDHNHKQTLLQHNLRQQQQILAQLHAHQQPPQKLDCANPMGLATEQQRDHNRRQRRQQEELQQRHNYLARLYSQFAPASYWRQ